MRSIAVTTQKQLTYKIQWELIDSLGQDSADKREFKSKDLLPGVH